MSNIVLFVLYFLFSCLGMIFIKFGGRVVEHVIFTVPIINLSLSLVSLLGFVCYSVSFILYASLLGRYDLSFLNPVTIGITSVLIFVSAVIFFGESISISKIIGMALIIIGVVIINIFNK